MLPLQATLKRYQTEHRSKLDSLEKSQAELKKIRRKSQGARNVLKYEHKEMEYLETVSSRQSDIQRFIAEGCREALLEEKRRFCFLVDKHCSFTQHMHFYHVQVSGAGANKRHPIRRELGSVSCKNSDDASLSRSTSVATGLNIMKRQKVKTIFPHTAGSNKTLLSFAQGDVITLLVAEEKDGWLYGEHDSTKVKGWFPSSYTRPLEEAAEEKAFVPVPSPAPIRSVSSVNLVEKGDVVLPPPDYLGSVQTDKRMEPSKGTAVKTPTDRPENAGPKPDVNGIIKPPFLSGENPFATVKLRPTVTNDRSAPIIR
ncbi:brain-specific angiogenesis inhibitor 1-associated protein 2-like protein 1 [Limosa lapponica baueri]|uniref:Brain-specific angiogenesis inhibitor 1-associated protein 2-like protein 1 n=1 Tax=Limosa lapponica baueri TaxID=1758121 RepID=A0A2I0UB05_LIMLA|nr:brain-specific angiogenesis inhibitor 1-associated protein 2-like protein 1 [Limosa lapponica baueri]